MRGIADPEIQSDLIGDSKTDRTLDETIIHCPEGARQSDQVYSR